MEALLLFSDDVDFVVAKGREAWAIEVKSGRSGKAAGLNRFRNQIAKNHLQSFMLDIYDKCYRYFDRQEIEGGSRQDEIFKNFIALVHENCISQREVTFYASKLCISTKYLTGICKSVTGEAAKKIIDDFAILEIKVLLQSTGLTIQEIADRLGFPDQSYLGRYFKRHEGMSPKEYQSKYSI